MKKVPPRIYGCDLGDKKSHVCALGSTGEVLGCSTVATTKNGFTRFFGGERAVRVVIEAGTHSPWVSALLEDLGHEVIVANPRNVCLISHNKSKSDRVDAELLARLARVDVKLLSPIQHRGARAREDLAMVRARSELVETRTKLINHVRGSMKSQGERHLRRRRRGYADYSNRCRTHLSLEKDAPDPCEAMGPDQGEVVAFPTLGGLHRL